MVFAVQISPSNAFSGHPYANANPTTNVTDNVSKVLSKHTLRAGMFIEITHKTQSSGGNNNGRFDFSRDSSNPGDTNWGFSNALLGNFPALRSPIFTACTMSTWIATSFTFRTTGRCARM